LVDAFLQLIASLRSADVGLEQDRRRVLQRLL
jgi:hypothetical protein